MRILFLLCSISLAPIIAGVVASGASLIIPVIVLFIIWRYRKRPPKVEVIDPPTNSLPPLLRPLGEERIPPIPRTRSPIPRPTSPLTRVPTPTPTPTLPTGLPPEDEPDEPKIPLTKIGQEEPPVTVPPPPGDEPDKPVYPNPPVQRFAISFYTVLVIFPVFVLKKNRT